MYTEKSFVLKPQDADKKWFLIDATDKIVGRLATEIADTLRGKNNPQYTPNTDSGDFVVVINASKVRFTGKKLDDKKYHRVSGYMGGLKTRTAKEQLAIAPEKVIMDAVKGMLPKNSLAKTQLTKLKVFAGETHAHEAQKPQPMEVK